MSRRKQKQRARDQRQQRKQRKSRGGAARKPRPETAPHLTDIELCIQHPELADPPVYVDASGVIVPDPYALLGLDSEHPPNAETVRTAFRAALAETPPEADSERARELLEARDLLLDPKRIMVRTLGDLRVPNPEHFVPGYERRELDPADGAQTTAVETDWSSRSRLVAMLTLYALLEDELEHGGQTEPRDPLLFE